MTLVREAYVNETEERMTNPAWKESPKAFVPSLLPTLAPAAPPISRPCLTNREAGALVPIRHSEA
jgi:hypothetical protein